MKLYTMPGTCSLAPNIAVAWENAPIEIANMAYGDHKKAAYREINPRAQVPALQFEDGDVLTEAAAILSFIGAEFGGEGSGAYARDKALGRREAEALSYMSSEVHAAYKGHFAPGALASSEAAQEEVKEKTYETLAGHYERLDAQLAGSGSDWLLGQKSYADAFLYVLCRWIEKTPLVLRDYPALLAHRERMEKDPGVLQALERQDMKPIG